jgi:hypothetical protein
MYRLLIALLLLPSAAAQETPAESQLPVKKIILYKTGVGYFEHRGTVNGDQQVAVPFTSGQLNDVLKSLTVLDLNGGRVTGITYNSSAPVDRQLGDLRLTPSEKPSLTEFLGALRGAKVEIRTGRVPITGRLLSVERKTRISNGISLEVDYLSLVTESGEVRSTEVTPSFTLRLLDPSLPAKVGRFLDLASLSRQPDVRRMVISAAGSGGRTLLVSYLSEAPVWKSTYRVVLDSTNPGSNLLQAWAIVDNTVGQDWDQVELSLASGAPQSFVQRISQPYYVRRPELPLPVTISNAPQTHQSTLEQGGARIGGAITDSGGGAIAGAQVKIFNEAGELVGQTTSDASGVYHVATLPEGKARVEVVSPGFQTSTVYNVFLVASMPETRNVQLRVGQATQTVDVSAQTSSVQTESASSSFGSLGSGRTLGGGRSKAVPPPPPPPAAPAPLYSSQGLSGGAAAAGFEAAAVAAVRGDAFEYRIKERVTLRRNESALVPILQSQAGAEKVSVWNPSSGISQPRRALWLTNATGLTLDGGTFSVLEDGSFVGEGLMEAIRPGEKRLLSYALDLALTVGSRDSGDPERITHVRVMKGVLTHSREIVTKRTYTLRNADAQPRTVIIEHPVRSGYQLKGSATPIETTADWIRFRVPVGPKQTATLVVEERLPTQTTYALSEITMDRTALWVQQRGINTMIEDSLKVVSAKRAAVSELESRKSTLDEESDKIYEDQQRLREN